MNCGFAETVNIGGLQTRSELVTRLRSGPNSLSLSAMSLFARVWYNVDS